MGLKPVGDSLLHFVFNTKILHKSISMLLVFFSYKKYKSIIGASTRNKKVPCFGLQRILGKVWVKFWWIIYYLNGSAHNIFKISVDFLALRYQDPQVIPGFGNGLSIQDG